MNDTAATIRTIIAELNTEFLERADAIHAVWLCLLSGQHGYLMGPAGTAKSALLNSVSRHIVGARYWHIQMDRMLDKSDSFGQYDIARFDTEKVWERDYADTFGDCHIALLDEIDKTGPASLVPYLEMLQNRRFKPGKHWVDSPLISAFGAANSSLSGKDGALKAIADRFLVKVPVDYLREQGHFLTLLSSAIGPTVSMEPTTITLEELRQVREVEIPAVTLPLGVATAMHRLRSDLAQLSVVASDRRWKAAVWVLQANAWLAGRSEITDEDLQVLRFILWSTEADIVQVNRAVLGVASAFTQALESCAVQLDEIAAEVAIRKGDSLESRTSYAGTAILKLTAIGDRLDGLAVTGVQHERLLEVQDLTTSVRISVLRECMGMSQDRASTHGRKP